MGFPTKIRELVHQKYDGRCAYCGHEITQRQMQVDHIKAKVEGGSDDMDNLNPACRACNNYKLWFSINDLRNKIHDQVRLARQYSVNFRLAERYGLIETTGAAVVFYFERVTDHDGPK
jgi:predicted restriction endonuclease